MTKKEPPLTPEEKEKRRKKAIRAWKRFAIKLGLVAAGLFIVFQFVFSVRIWKDNRMYPNVHEGDLIICAKYAAPILDDVVLYKTPDGSEHLGRIAAQEEESVVIADGNVFEVNGNVIWQRLPYNINPGDLSYPYTVPHDAVFILNDYRENPYDSRKFGGIDQDSIIGVVVFSLRHRGF